MFDSIVKSISKLLGGSKSERDVKEVMPYVNETLAFGDKLRALSIDELRAKTDEFRKRISEYKSKEEETERGGRIETKQ